MISERVLNIISGILMFIMMGFICYYLADGWMPDKIYLKVRPQTSYTQSSYEELQKKAMLNEQKYNEITRILER